MTVDLHADVLPLLQRRVSGTVSTTGPGADSNSVEHSGEQPSASFEAPTAEAGTPLARTSELGFAAAAAAPALIWRSAKQSPSHAVHVASQAQSAAILREAATDGGEGASTSAPADAWAAPPAIAADSAAAAAPDIDEIAEQVSRLLARRLQVERERRGGSGWK